MDEHINDMLKQGGFLKQVQKGKYSVRLHIIGGQVSLEKLTQITKISEKFGLGYVHITSRQSIEIPFIDFKDIVPVKQELELAGLEIGVSGPNVRGIVACQGNSVCRYGLIDTSELACEIDGRYYGKVLPHKFKIGLTGCKNNCLKVEENDLGIKGAAIVSWNRGGCNFCGVCENVCNWHVIRIDKLEKTLVHNSDMCENCGKCVELCPKSCWSTVFGYKVFIGGSFGKNIVTGKQYTSIITDAKTLFHIIDAVIAYFAEFAKPKERLYFTLKRIGENVLKDRLTKIINSAE
jgi:dissimilatory sulfite reductase (desulfoviridin) alpha/beta subunit